MRTAIVLAIALATFNVEDDDTGLDEDRRPGALLEEEITVLLAMRYDRIHSKQSLEQK